MGFREGGVPKGIRTPVARMKTWCPDQTRRWGHKIVFHTSAIYQECSIFKKQTQSNSNTSISPIFKSSIPSWIKDKSPTIIQTQSLGVRYCCAAL